MPMLSAYSDIEVIDEKIETENAKLYDLKTDSEKEEK